MAPEAADSHSSTASPDAQTITGLNPRQDAVCAHTSRATSPHGATSCAACQRDSAACTANPMAEPGHNIHIPLLGTCGHPVEWQSTPTAWAPEQQQQEHGSTIIGEEDVSDSRTPRSDDHGSCAVHVHPNVWSGGLHGSGVLSHKLARCRDGSTWLFHATNQLPGKI